MKFRVELTGSCSTNYWLSEVYEADSVEEAKNAATADFKSNPLLYDVGFDAFPSVDNICVELIDE